MNAAIYYNNAGICYLEQGNHNDALDLLKEAAQRIYSLTVARATSNMAITYEDNSFDEPSMDCDMASKSHDIPRRPLISPAADNSSFMCSIPIFLSAPNNTETCTEESAVILYNMALTYHLNSLSANPVSNAHANAITLFGMAYDLCLRLHQNERTSRVIMSSLNNMGVLHHDLGNYSLSHQYFEDLSFYIGSLDEATDRSVANERNGFLLNSIVLRNEAHGAAAA
jgi:tetratricopeptide (TPR) repeat protein